MGTDDRNRYADNDLDKCQVEVHSRPACLILEVYIHVPFKAGSARP